MVTIAALLSALCMAVPAGGAESDDRGWATIKRLGVEHRAQACRYWAYNGVGMMRGIIVRGNSRQAQILSAYKLHFYVDGLHYRDPRWDAVPAGRIGARTDIPDGPKGAFRVRMKIRTIYGTTSWSRWRPFRTLPFCP